jgi:hypothetical protein
MDAPEWIEFALVGLVAFGASGLTLYSGFGLGTILLPAFALFFPVEAAVAATAVVHLLNNLFKGALLFRTADWTTVIRFGLPAVPAAVAGAWLLGILGGSAPLFEWFAGGRSFGPTAAGVTIGGLMIVLALLELQSWFQRLAAPPRLMPVGGLITGFVGGLTGHQGAFRSIFLLKSGLDPARFIATGVLIAVLVDVSRLPAYAASLLASEARPGDESAALIAFATASALAGAGLGVRFLKKATIGFVRSLVALLMLLIGAALVGGVVGS